MREGLPGHTENPFFVFRAQKEEVLNGSLVDMVIDCGFAVRHHARLSLYGIDAREIPSGGDDAESPDGRPEAVFTEKWMNDTRADVDHDWPFIITTIRDSHGKHGKYLAEVYRRDTGMCLNNDLKTEFPELAQ